MGLLFRFILTYDNISALMDFFPLIFQFFFTDMVFLPIEAFTIKKPFTASFMMSTGAASNASGSRSIIGSTASAPIVIQDDSDSASPAVPADPAPHYIIQKDQFTYYSATDKYHVNDPARVKPSILGYASTKTTSLSHQPYAGYLSDAMKDGYDNGGAVSTHILGRFSDYDVAYLRELHQDMVQTGRNGRFKNTVKIIKALKELP